MNRHRAFDDFHSTAASSSSSSTSAASQRTLRFSPIIAFSPPLPQPLSTSGPHPVAILQPSVSSSYPTPNSNGLGSLGALPRSPPSYVFAFAPAPAHYQSSAPHVAPQPAPNN